MSKSFGVVSNTQNSWIQWCGVGWGLQAYMDHMDPGWAPHRWQHGTFCVRHQHRSILLIKIIMVTQIVIEPYPLVSSLFSAHTLTQSFLIFPHSFSSTLIFFFFNLELPIVSKLGSPSTKPALLINFKRQTIERLEKLKLWIGVVLTEFRPARIIQDFKITSSGQGTTRLQALPRQPKTKLKAWFRLGLGKNLPGQVSLVH